MNKTLDWLNFQIRLIRVGIVRGNPLYIGAGSTKLFLTFLIILALLPQRTDGEWSWRIWSFVLSPPNEIGDTLAGIAGALAFLWIIVTVMIQSNELSAQREELRLTRKEFSRMAEAQEKQLEALSSQAEIFIEEKKQRLEDNSKEMAYELVKTIRFRLRTTLLLWKLRKDSLGSSKDIYLNPFGIESATDQIPDDEFFTELLVNVPRTLKKVVHNIEIGEIVARPPRFRLQSIQADLNELIDILPHLSSSQGIRFSRLRLKALRAELAALSDGDIWASTSENSTS